MYVYYIYTMVTRNQIFKALVPNNCSVLAQNNVNWPRPFFSIYGLA